MKTDSYFDRRPDARFFVATINGIVVSIRENVSTTPYVTDGEVWIAWRVDNVLIEHRFVDTVKARLHLAEAVVGKAALLRSIKLVPWIAIAREEHAVPCSICQAAFAQPCVEDGVPLMSGKVIATVVGAPCFESTWQVICPDGRVRHYPFHNEGDARSAASRATTRRCRSAPEPSPLELEQPPCPGGDHIARANTQHDVELDTMPLVHAIRITDFHRSLRGDGEPSLHIQRDNRS